MSFALDERFAALPRIRLDDLPDVRISAPNCDVALLEVYARWKFGISDLDRAYFSHGFVYEPPSATCPAIGDDGVLNLSLRNTDHAGRLYREKLRRFYGLDWDSRAYDRFDSLLLDIHSALRVGQLVMSSFDLGFLKAHRAYGISHGPHSICPIGLDVEASVVFAIGNIGGQLAIPLSDYEACFEYLRSQAEEVTLRWCNRISDEVLWPGPLEIRADLKQSLAHLFADHPHSGLSGLQNGVTAIQWAVDHLHRPFSVPGLWTLSHDRHNLRSHVATWHETELASRATLSELDDLVNELCTSWNKAEILTQDALANDDLAPMRELHHLLSRLLDKEARAGELLRQVCAELPNS